MNASARNTVSADSLETPITPGQPLSSIADLATIGDLARIYGVTLRALRFYEQRGLLRPFRKGAARLYDANQRNRLQLILKGKQLGFTLAEIAEVLDADGGRIATDAFALDEKMVQSQLQHLEGKRADLDQAIAELRATRDRMMGLAS
jgi:DNA-binding transcriptional MerR regulator